MMHYRLRTLLIVLALGPPVLGWMLVKVEKYQSHRNLRRLALEIHQYHGDSVLPPPTDWLSKP